MMKKVVRLAQGHLRPKSDTGINDKCMTPIYIQVGMDGHPSAQARALATLGRFLGGAFFRKCIFPEGRSKELPKMGLPGG